MQAAHRGDYRLIASGSMPVRLCQHRDPIGVANPLIVAIQQLRQPESRNVDIKILGQRLNLEIMSVDFDSIIVMSLYRYIHGMLLIWLMSTHQSTTCPAR